MIEVVPSALGVALSPVPILAMILLLGRPHAPGRGAAFALGWVGGLIVATALLIGSGDGGDGGAGSLGPGPEVAVGSLLLVLALWQWRTRPRDGEPSLLARWMLVVDRLGVARCAVLGVALCCVNPKNLALTASAGSSIGGHGAAATLALATVFVALGSISVAGPALWCALAPAQAARPLQAVRDLMTTYGVAITVVVSALVGVKLLGDGIGGL